MNFSLNFFLPSTLIIDRLLQAISIEPCHLTDYLVPCPLEGANAGVNVPCFPTSSFTITSISCITTDATTASLRFTSTAASTITPTYTDATATTTSSYTITATSSTIINNSIINNNNNNNNNINTSTDGIITGENSNTRNNSTNKKNENATTDTSTYTTTAITSLQPTDSVTLREGGEKNDVRREAESEEGENGERNLESAGDYIRKDENLYNNCDMYKEPKDQAKNDVSATLPMNSVIAGNSSTSVDTSDHAHNLPITSVCTDVVTGPSYDTTHLPDDAVTSLNHTTNTSRLPASSNTCQTTCNPLPSLSMSSVLAFTTTTVVTATSVGSKSSTVSMAVRSTPVIAGESEYARSFKAPYTSCILLPSQPLQLSAGAQRGLMERLHEWMVHRGMRLSRVLTYPLDALITHPSTITTCTHKYFKGLLSKNSSTSSSSVLLALVAPLDVTLVRPLVYVQRLIGRLIDMHLRTSMDLLVLVQTDTLSDVEVFKLADLLPASALQAAKVDVFKVLLNNQSTLFVAMHFSHTL